MKATLRHVTYRHLASKIKVFFRPTVGRITSRDLRVLTSVQFFGSQTTL